ncbi:MAG TPA: hypothetical protein PLH23_14730, partial [Hyphomonadaceae bacterium]|nr:hypothetical protein [Hyphomonadaceae bacterium]HPI49526.1 hypothetical protein [Hyphomonadaceae bacterium]
PSAAANATIDTSFFIIPPGGTFRRPVQDRLKFETLAASGALFADGLPALRLIAATVTRQTSAPGV